MIATSTLQSPNSWRRTSQSRGGRCESCRKMLFERSSNNWFFFLTLLLFFSCSKPTMPSPWAVKWNFWPWIAATDHRGRKAKATTRTSNRKPRRYNLITYTYTFFLFKMLSESSFLDYYTYFYFPLFVCIFFLLKKPKTIASNLMLTKERVLRTFFSSKRRFKLP